jgi:glycosyltransferase involved in cell wall biosynthesis
VLVVQAQVKHYRVPFFEQLHETLARDGVTLRVAYSDPSPSEAKKGDNQDLPAEYGVKVRCLRILGERVFYQPLLSEILAADLVVVEQANKHVLNYLLFPLSALGIKKVAFWGHGRNRQRQGRKFAEWLKKSALNRVDWWFAYTEGTARYLIERGVPACKITSVQNAVDTGEFRQQCASISQTEIRAARRQLNIPETASVGLFCGGIFREKLPSFLIESARQIRQSLPDFELLIVGAGPEQEVMEAASCDASWIHCLGPKFGWEKALLFRLADVLLMPGLVGLAILDAFSAGIPVVTSSVPYHSPEIEYLEEGRNGMMTKVDQGAYSEAVVHVLSDTALLTRLKHGALESSQKYTLEGMVERFRSGIFHCLSGPVQAIKSNKECIDRPHHGRMGEL